MLGSVGLARLPAAHHGSNKNIKMLRAFIFLRTALRPTARWLVMIIYLIALCAAPAAMAGVDVDAKTPIIFTDKSARVLDDPEGNLTPQQALARAAEFRPVADVGKLDKRRRYWVLSELHSTLDTDRELRIDAPQWEEVRNYLISPSGELQALRVTGNLWGTYAPLVDTNPFVRASSTELSQWPVFTLRHGERTQVLSSLRPSMNFQSSFAPVQFIDHARFLELRRFGLHLEGVLAGVLLALAVFGWYSAMHNKDRTSVMYAVWIMFALFSASSLRVHDGMRLMEFYIDVEGIRFGNVTAANMLTTTFAYGQSMGYVIFARSFLELKSRMPLVFRFTNLYLLLTVCHLLLLLFIDHGLSLKALWLPLWGMILTVLLTIYVCAFIRYREGQRIAKFFMIAMIPYIFFRFVFFLGLVDVQSPFLLLPKNGFGLFMQNPNTAQAIGVAAEAMIMALAVFSKNRWLQEELNQNVRAQAELIQNQNVILEATVAERTRELSESKAKTEQQHQMVVDSITYASRLQKAQLPRSQRLAGQYAAIQAIWEPRDTIGGDVWWASLPDSEGRVALALADSTGHGVPGAMLSVLISTSLERMFATDPEINPSAALMALDQALRLGLNQDSADAESDDGCDAAMVRIDRQHRQLEFAGAKLGLLHLRPDGEVERVQPSRISLGYQQPPREAPELHRIGYQPGSIFVLVSDGFTDQVGGDGSARRAYGNRRLTDLLHTCHGESVETIAQRMRQSLADWQGSELRRDDVTAIVFQPL